MLNRRRQINNHLALFETHADCIVKGQRDVVFGHKVNFTGGKSNLIFDCILERGNPIVVTSSEWRTQKQ